MVIILTEKPSAARNFAKALGGMSGTFNGEKYRIVNSYGHIYSYPKKVSSLVPVDKKEKYENWEITNLPWDPSDFKWKIEPKENAHEAIETIKSALSSASEVCVATDNDPTGEGDLLAWEILLALKWKGKTTRMIFDDESAKSIQTAFPKRFEVPSPESHGPFVKARARSKFDYLSMQFTRMATLVARERGHSVVLRQGRLKSVMVSLIGKQLDLVKNYKKVPFFEVRFKDENGNIFKRKDEDADRFERADVVDIASYSESPIVIDKKENRGMKPGSLLDLAGLGSILGSRGYDTKEVQATYQKMYEDGIVSYPRTEDKKITPEQFEELKNNRFAIADVIGVSHTLLTHEDPWDDKKGPRHVQESAAHGANRPGPVIPDSLDSLRSYGASGPAIYELLARNSLAIFGEAYVYEHQEGHLEKYPDFTGSTNIPLKLGFKEIFDTGDDDEEKTDKSLGKGASPYIHEGANPKPKNPTMVWLLGDSRGKGQLQKYNVGTGSTRLSTFNEIIEGSGKNASMQLVKMSKKGVLSFAPAGECSYILLKDCEIASPEVTERLYKDMAEVGTFKKDQNEIMHSITPIMLHDMDCMRRNALNLPAGEMQGYVPKEKVTGVFIPTGEDISFNTSWGGYTFTEKEIADLLNGETIEIQVKNKDGKPYKVRGFLAKDKYKGKTFWGFQRKIEVPDSFCGHFFTPEEKESLMSGESVYVEKMRSNQGKVFNAKLCYLNGKIEFVKELPSEFGRHVFTKDEKELLLEGKTVFVSGLWSESKGKRYDADLIYEDGRIKPVFSAKKKKGKKKSFKDCTPEEQDAIISSINLNDIF